MKPGISSARRLPSLLLLALAGLLAAACGALSTPVPTASPVPTATSSPSLTFTPTFTFTPSPSVTATPTPTRTQPHATPSSALKSASLTATPTLTPTPEFPPVTVSMQANCRYGPGTAYLYRWGLYPGDQADVRGRNWSGTWYWIHPFNLEGDNCWASEIVFEKRVDLSQVPVVSIPLPHTTFAGPPGNIQAVRDGDRVTVSWDDVPLSDDKRRGYLIEANICQNGAELPFIVQTDRSSYTFEDPPNCAEKSSGLLYTAEKHGYSDPVQIPWP